MGCVWKLTIQMSVNKRRFAEHVSFGLQSGEVRDFTRVAGNALPGFNQWLRPGVYMRIAERRAAISWFGDRGG